MFSLQFLGVSYKVCVGTELNPRLRPSPFGSVDFSQLWRKLDWPPTLLSTHSVDILVSNVWHTFGLKLGRCGRFWSFGSTWFRPTSAAFLVRIPYERHLQILDTNHSCSMPTQATSTAHRSWYRSPKTTFVGNSTINDRFSVRQSVRPTIARQPISPTI
ncbi:unnamed protein product [Schistosoma margrebowiei]|uniref:Uncharacterized protein n=1 Tax=Schistosoma margrebowiei TaxID=48269 RepID=A0A183MVT2_9TREM|nr:unnamed protein product [Schistosoma margrebowiei]